MKTKFITTMMLAIAIAALIVTPALSAPGKGKGPKYTYYVASLFLVDEADNSVTICGKAIFNVNPTDDGKYQLEVEIEECAALAGTAEELNTVLNTVDVYFDGNFVGTIGVDENGNGKATFYVDSILTESSSVEIVDDGETVLTSGTWEWFKGPQPQT